MTIRMSGQKLFHGEQLMRFRIPWMKQCRHSVKWNRFVKKTEGIWSLWIVDKMLKLCQMLSKLTCPKMILIQLIMQLVWHMLTKLRLIFSMRIAFRSQKDRSDLDIRWWHPFRIFQSVGRRVSLIRRFQKSNKEYKFLSREPQATNDCTSIKVTRGSNDQLKWITVKCDDFDGTYPICEYPILPGTNESDYELAPSIFKCLDLHLNTNYWLLRLGLLHFTRWCITR